MRFLRTIEVGDLPPDPAQLPNRLAPFIWHFVRQAKGPLFIIAGCWTLSNILWALSFYYVKLFVDGLGRTTPAHMYHDLFWVIVGFIGLILIGQSVFWRSGAYLEARTMARFTNMVRRQLALYLHNHSYSYFQDDFAGRLASKVVETPLALRNVVVRINESFIGNIVSLATSCALFALVGWQFVVLIGFVIAWYTLILKKFIPILIELSTIAADRQSHMRGRYVDIVTNILNVKIFARKDHEDQYFLSSLSDTADGYETLALKYFSLQQWLDTFLKCLWFFPTALALEFWHEGRISSGDVALMFTLCLSLGRDLWNFCFALADFSQDIGQVQEGMQAITQSFNVVDKPGATDLSVYDAHIAFRDVTFAYGGHTVFRNFNLDIPPGQRVGLVGPSGAGKSTLIQLLLRLYDVQQGAIMIDGQDIANIRQDSLREAIAMIPQTTELMHRSIRDNILYGRLDAGDNDVVNAAQQAYAHDFIVALEDGDGRRGYDAHAGERGVKLSGGQRQRIAIARAILKDAPILILDEATSALDSESEKSIQDSLVHLMHGKTVMAIAHRLSTIAHMDRLIVLDQGRIVEDGSHADLLAHGGLYARLWALQSGGFLK